MYYGRAIKRYLLINDCSITVSQTLRDTYNKVEQLDACKTN